MNVLRKEVLELLAQKNKKVYDMRRQKVEKEWAARPGEEGSLITETA